MSLEDADTVFLDAAAAVETFSIPAPTALRILSAVALMLVCTTHYQCIGVDLNSVLQLDKMISSLPALLAHVVTETSGTELLRRDTTETITLILRNKATVLDPSGKTAVSGCNVVPLQRCASYHLSSSPLLPDFTATA